jgi:hypothetical protein
VPTGNLLRSSLRAISGRIWKDLAPITVPRLRDRQIRCKRGSDLGSGGPSLRHSDTVHFELASGCNVTAYVSNAVRSGSVAAVTTNFTPEPGEGFVDSHKGGQVTVGGSACPPPEPPLSGAWLIGFAGH